MSASSARTAVLLDRRRSAPPSPLCLPYPPLWSSRIRALVAESSSPPVVGRPNLIVVFWGAASNAPSLVLVRAVHRRAPPPPNVIFPVTSYHPAIHRVRPGLHSRLIVTFLRAGGASAMILSSSSYLAWSVSIFVTHGHHGGKIYSNFANATASHPACVMP